MTATIRRAAMIVLTGALVCLAAGPAGGQANRDGSVLRAELRGTVTPVTAEHLTDAVAAAEDGGYTALLIEMDTPGGLDSAMRDIVTAFLNARVPVIVHVAPGGARAASAGAVITLSSHVAAMAPGTNIGAATPIDLQGGEVIDKVVNDAAAYTRAIAEERGRDVDFAVDMVREGASVSAEEAVELGVVDLLAANTDVLLSDLDGRTVTLADDREVTLSTAGAAVEDLEVSWIRQLLQRVADPNLAFLFLSLGTLAILYEIASPGLGLGGIGGAILLILAFYALSVLPTNLAGVALVILGLTLLVAELFVPGVGVLAGGGAVALLLGGLLLFQRPTGIGIDLAFLVPTAGLAGLGAVSIAVLAGRMRSRPAMHGERALVGRAAEVRTADGHRGQVWVDGALWRARSPGSPLKPGARVRVVDQEGLTLTVEPEEEQSWTH